MNVLVDYDNIPRHHRNRGIDNIVDKIADALPANLLPHGTNITLRLYGGWYRYRKLSRIAQSLTAEIAKYSPATVRLGSSPARRLLRASVELARSMLIDPSQIIPNTFRIRNAPSNLHPRAIPFTGCADSVLCPLKATHDLFANDRCPAVGCLTEVADVVQRDEQKLVDTMLTADLIYTTSLRKSDIVVVTSDDDLWLGIRTAISLGACVHHVHTQPSRRTPRYYSGHVGYRYREYSF